MIKDIVAEGIESGWKHYDASALTNNLTLEADVVIVGTGAGGGTSAEILSKAGLKVVMIEEGPLKSVRDFKMLESDAYPQLYHESASRKTKDKGIDIYQGRCVGGGTTVNWTTSFRTPPKTLEHWTDVYGLKGFAEKEMAPWFKVMEERLNIAKWELPPNENNEVLRIGCEKLGIPYGVISRNVRECRDLGYCGMGCPIGAKQDMLHTTIPAALQRGAVIVSRARAEQFIFINGKVQKLECIAMDMQGNRPAKYRVTVKADYYILSAGAVGSPALLMRSKLPDPNKLVGKRTFLHPVAASAAIMPEPVEAFSGAPQSIYSDHFLYPADNVMGYWLEIPPIHPIMAGTKMRGHGRRHSGLMSHFPYLQVIIALTRDGFHEKSVGGTVELKKDGTPVLDYPITDYVWDGLRRSLKYSLPQVQPAWFRCTKRQPLIQAGRKPNVKYRSSRWKSCACGLPPRTRWAAVPWVNRKSLQWWTAAAGITMRKIFIYSTAPPSPHRLRPTLSFPYSLWSPDRPPCSLKILAVRRPAIPCRLKITIK